MRGAVAEDESEGRRKALMATKLSSLEVYGVAIRSEIDAARAYQKMVDAGRDQGWRSEAAVSAR